MMSGTSDCAGYRVCLGHGGCMILSVAGWRPKIKTKNGVVDKVEKLSTAATMRADGVWQIVSFEVGLPPQCVHARWR